MKVRHGIVPPSTRKGKAKDEPLEPPVNAPGVPAGDAASIPPPPPKSDASPATKITADSTKILINDVLDAVIKSAEQGADGFTVGSKILDARDKIQEKVSVSPAFHEMATLARSLSGHGTSKLPESVLEELDDKIRKWKNRLTK
jgi:hypothetical protein